MRPPPTGSLISAKLTMSLHPPPSARANSTPASPPAPRLVFPCTTSQSQRGGSTAPDRTVAGELAGVQVWGRWVAVHSGQLTISQRQAATLYFSPSALLVHVAFWSDEHTAERDLPLARFKPRFMTRERFAGPTRGTANSLRVLHYTRSPLRALGCGWPSTQRFAAYSKDLTVFLNDRFVKSPTKTIPSPFSQTRPRQQQVS